jgi:hypothetical protein
LIIGTGALHAELTDAFVQKQERVVTTFYSEGRRESLKPAAPGKARIGKGPREPKTENPAAGAGDAFFSLPWNPGSSLGSRNLILQTEQRLGGIDQAFLIFPSGKFSEPFHQLTIAAVEKTLDYRVKSYLLLLRDLLNYFMDKKSGSLFGILHFEEGERASPLVAGAYEMFRTAFLSCLSIYQGESFNLIGFESSSADLSGYRDLIVKSSGGGTKPGLTMNVFPPRGLFSRAGRRRPD